MRLILIRHADAYAGFDGIISGPSGCRGLTDLGRAQAAALCSHLAATGRLRADVLLSSVLPRAIETARIIAPGLGFDGFAQRCDLCEVHTGEADGLTWHDYTKRYGSFDMEAEPTRVFAPDGESWTTFHERVSKLLDELVAEFAGQTVVAVCHAGVIMASFHQLLAVPNPAARARLQPMNTGLTEWQYEEERQRWTLHSFNELTHLLRYTDGASHFEPGGKVGSKATTDHGEPRYEFSVDGARTAARENRLRDWVARFLASPGSDNAVLAETLSTELAWWAGPLQLPLDQLNRLAGPPGQPVLCPVDDEYWDVRVEEMDQLTEQGWDPPPVIVAYRNGELVLEDGNHRTEGVRRAGRQSVWAVVGFAEQGVRDRFTSQWLGTTGKA